MDFFSHFGNFIYFFVSSQRVSQWLRNHFYVLGQPALVPSQYTEVKKILKKIFFRNSQPVQKWAYTVFLLFFELSQSLNCIVACRANYITEKHKNCYWAALNTIFTRDVFIVFLNDNVECFCLEIVSTSCLITIFFL